MENFNLYVENFNLYVMIDIGQQLLVALFLVFLILISHHRLLQRESRAKLKRRVTKE